MEELTKTKEYKSYVKELTKLYMLLNEEQINQLDIVLTKHRELEKKIEEICRIKLSSLNKLKKKIKG